MLRCYLGSYVLCVPDVPYGGLSQQLVSTFPFPRVSVLEF
jgi:hypothetical protein